MYVNSLRAVIDYGRILPREAELMPEWIAQRFEWYKLLQWTEYSETSHSEHPWLVNTPL